MSILREYLSVYSRCPLSTETIVLCEKTLSSPFLASRLQEQMRLIFPRTASIDEAKVATALSYRLPIEAKDRRESYEDLFSSFWLSQVEGHSEKEIYENYDPFFNYAICGPLNLDENFQERYSSGQVLHVFTSQFSIKEDYRRQIDETLEMIIVTTVNFFREEEKIEKVNLFLPLEEFLLEDDQRWSKGYILSSLQELTALCPSLQIYLLVDEKIDYLLGMDAKFKMILLTKASATIITALETPQEITVIVNPRSNLGWIGDEGIWGDSFESRLVSGINNKIPNISYLHNPFLSPILYDPVCWRLASKFTSWPTVPRLWLGEETAKLIDILRNDNFSNFDDSLDPDFQEDSVLPEELESCLVFDEDDLNPGGSGYDSEEDVENYEKMEE